MQQIDLYCKNCNKSFKIAHVISGDDSTPVLQNTVIGPMSRFSTS